MVWFWWNLEWYFNELKTGLEYQGSEAFKGQQVALSHFSIKLKPEISIGLLRASIWKIMKLEYSNLNWNIPIYIRILNWNSLNIWHADRSLGPACRLKLSCPYLRLFFHCFRKTEREKNWGPLWGKNSGYRRKMRKIYDKNSVFSHLFALKQGKSENYKC